MSYIQRASLEKRLQTCCTIDTYVALFSCFFNLFQLTEVVGLREGGSEPKGDHYIHALVVKYV